MLLKRLLSRPQDPPELTIELDDETYAVRLQRQAKRKIDCRCARAFEVQGAA